MRKIISLLIMFVIVYSFSCYVMAEKYPKEPTNWKVEFDGKKIVSNYDAAEIQKILKSMEPGDSATLEFSLVNRHSTDVEWWMENDVVASLEDKSKTAQGGAYAYEVFYVTPSGEKQVLFSSEKVGGEKKSGKGLHEATDALKDYFYLDTVKPGTTAKVTIQFELEGESQSNSYQDASGELKVNFAVEIPPQGTTTVKVIKVPNTGDTANTTVYLIEMLLSALGLAAVLFLVRKQRKGEDNE